MNGILPYNDPKHQGWLPTPYEKTQVQLFHWDKKLVNKISTVAQMRSRVRPPTGESQILRGRRKGRRNRDSWEKKRGEKCDFRWYQTKEKNVTARPLPPNLPLPSSMLGTAQVRDLLKCNKVTIFLETWSHCGATWRILLKGTDSNPTRIFCIDFKRLSITPEPCGVETNAERVVGKVWEGSQHCCCCWSSSWTETPALHSLAQEQHPLSRNRVQGELAQAWASWNAWRVKIHQKFETCCTKAIRKGLHLLLTQ